MILVEIKNTREAFVTWKLTQAQKFNKIRIKRDVNEFSLFDWKQRRRNSTLKVTMLKIRRHKVC